MSKSVVTSGEVVLNHIITLSPHSYGLSPSSTDWRAKYNEAADMLSEARNELDDFVHSSKELEEELLRELERTEKTQKELKDKISRVEYDREDWKVRCPLHTSILWKWLGPHV